MKCVVHAHSLCSGICRMLLLKRIRLENYNETVAVCQALKQSGMDLITITRSRRHLRRRATISIPDPSAGAGVTGTLPSEIPYHCGVHACGAIIPVLEVLNNVFFARANRLVGQLARLDDKIEIGGSDSHAMFSLGAAWTEVPGARTKDEFWKRARAGQCSAAGIHGSYWKLVRAVSGFGMKLPRHKQHAAALAPLLLILPIYLWGVITPERFFAKRRQGSAKPARRPVLEAEA